MRGFFILFLSLFPIISFSQEFRINEVDSFTGERKLYTSYETFSPATMSNSYEVRFCFFKESTPNIRLRLMVTYPKNVLAIKKEAQILIKTDKGIHVLLAEESNISTHGGAKTRFSGSGALGIRIDAVGDLSFLENETVQALRVNYTDGYIDSNPIKEKNAKIIRDSYILIKSEMDN